MKSEVRAVGLGMLLVLGLSAISTVRASVLPPKHPPVIITECGVPVRAYMMNEHGLRTYRGAAAIRMSHKVSPTLWTGTFCSNK